MKGHVLIGAGGTLAAAIVVVTVLGPRDTAAPVSNVLAAASPGPSATPLPQPSPFTPTPLPTQAGSAAGYHRVVSTDGGWSMELPDGWTTLTAPARTTDIGSFELRGAPVSGNAPSADQLRIRISLMTDPERLSLEALGARGALSSVRGPPVEQIRTTVAGLSAVRTTLLGYSPPPLDQLHVFWHVRSPHLVDRIIAIDVWPADGRLRAEADRAVATMALFTPRPWPSVPTVSRDAAIATALQATSGGPVDHIAAKLVTHQEYENGLHAGRARSFTVDPEQLLWVVVMIGDFGPVPRGGPPGPGSSPAAPAQTHLIVAAFSATGDTGFGYGGMWSPYREWPAWFDALRDRAP